MIVARCYNWEKCKTPTLIISGDDLNRSFLKAKPNTRRKQIKYKFDRISLCSFITFNYSTICITILVYILIKHVMYSLLCKHLKKERSPGPVEKQEQS